MRTGEQARGLFVWSSFIVSGYDKCCHFGFESRHMQALWFLFSDVIPTLVSPRVPPVRWTALKMPSCHFSFPRWQNIVNVMIQKDPGNTKIHRLRVIHLYEADYNFLLGFKWRQLLHHGEENKTIHQGQHGGRPGHEATTLVFMEELKNNISYATRKSLINLDNDAASCYNEIIPALASLLGRSHGLHRNVIFVNARTLKEAKFKLRTSTGISDAYYSHCHTFPIYGTGQGSGNSPVI